MTAGQMCRMIANIKSAFYFYLKTGNINEPMSINSFTG